MMMIIRRGLVYICIACWLSIICRIGAFVVVLPTPLSKNCVTSSLHPSTKTSHMKVWKRCTRRKKNKHVSLNASTSTTYDLIVIGGGSAGLTAAKFAATFGKSVCLVESNNVGGDWKVCTS